MTPQEQEILDILQEECAEVIQMVSKIRRFGLDEVHLKDGRSNRAKLAEEIGDLLCLVSMATDRNIVSSVEVQIAIDKKRDKLRIWSTIFK